MKAQARPRLRDGALFLALLALSVHVFHMNPLRIAADDFFATFQRDSENLVVGRIVADDMGLDRRGGADRLARQPVAVEAARQLAQADPAHEPEELPRRDDERHERHVEELGSEWITHTADPCRVGPSDLVAGRSARILAPGERSR